MNGLSDEMYCSEQICIPPSFPYLLGQYAKAAIRTQPSDLLKWSTAYFRCLSLNIPPPVKPRLEYPVPRDFHGITPGWLKALIYQLQNNLTIPFKILWDRWIGACLKHQTLIQLLCLGGFDDPQAINWPKFIALCAGTLSDDLTHTMILICEILTEEPEGGSAMITLETFVNLYTFLAKIDASSDQNLRNYFFRDSLLSLWKDKVEKLEEKEIERETEVLEIEESLVSKQSSVSELESKVDDADRVVSCPSLPEDDQYSIDYLLKEEQVEEEEEEEEGEEHIDGQSSSQGKMLVEDIEQHQEEQGEEESNEGVAKEKSASKLKEKKSDKDLDSLGEPKDDEAEEDVVKEKRASNDKDEEADKPVDNENIDAKEAEDGGAAEATEVPEGEVKEEVKQIEQEDVTKDEGDLALKEYESVDTIVDQPVRDLEHIFEDDANLREDLERLRALQQEMAGETDEELEKFKCRLIAEMPLSQSQEEGIKHFATAAEKLEDHSSEEKLKTISGERVLKSDEGSTSTVDEVDGKGPYEEVVVEAIPGIGGIVPDNLIMAVVEYMKNCAKNQHGMVMPRNIRHYNCPPLEVLDN
ncbi:DNA ligase 1-like [Anthonomus grandis grandis]|uniref:DNA ligase 1-like n=1 Tax=Anthonomus grandis grandis TaxID=2921223 RepID=UPI002166A616|nr:DNA ligase 1-like [Anthonomus grandis grandis]